MPAVVIATSRAETSPRSPNVSASGISAASRRPYGSSTLTAGRRPAFSMSNSRRLVAK